MTPLLDGIRRVNSAPMIVAGVWAMTLFISVPMAVAMRGMLADHLGSSLMADAAAAGADSDWMQEFGDQATGLGVTFKPTIIGFGAVLDNLSGFLDQSARPVVVIGAAAVYIVLWMFIAGGILDRYARDRATRDHAFFAACGVFFFRFLRLAVIQGIVYLLLFGTVHPWVFDDLYPRLIHEVSVERTAFFIRAALYALFFSLVAAASVVFDYAKVRAVVEDRRSMFAAVQAAISFIRRHAGAALGLFAVNAGLFLLVIAAYALLAPDAGRTGVSMWAGAALGQTYIVARLWVKLVFWASATALFQSRLAHAGYVARPLPVWPESPAAEAIQSPGLS